MINHKKVYIDYFGYAVGDIVICEVCKHQVSDINNFKEKPPVLREAVDIHHIIPRSKGGSNRIRGSKYPLDFPENLIALCREHHIEAESCKETNKRFRIIHLKNIINKIQNG